MSGIILTFSIWKNIYYVVIMKQIQGKEKEIVLNCTSSEVKVINVSRITNTSHFCKI